MQVGSIWACLMGIFGRDMELSENDRRIVPASSGDSEPGDIGLKLPRDDSETFCRAFRASLALAIATAASSSSRASPPAIGAAITTVGVCAGLLPDAEA